MLISMNWIKDYVDLSGLDTAALVNQFTLSTAEVEEVFRKGENVGGVVSAKVLSEEPHPNSRKLHLLKVDDGSAVHDVVCGAPNARAGITVALARLGARVGELTIGEAMLAGYPSRGMCCSEAELGISADHTGILELPDGTPLGVDIKELLPIDDVVFEVDNKSLTNRPDLWGHYGIAREFAVLTGRPLKPLDLFDFAPYADLPPVGLAIEDAQLCYRYSSIKADNITAKSPAAMRIRLFYCGMRALNLLADLTNYVMLELGQPMHAFDAAKVGKVEVRRFPEAFRFVTLDGVERTIPPEALMICSGGEPVAVAGIMGGEASSITDETSALLLESANFDGVNVRRVSAKIGLRTDASQRYEKTLDPELTILGVGRFAKLLLEADPGVKIITRLTDAYVKRFEPIRFSLEKSYIDRYAGMEVPWVHIEGTLRALGFGLDIRGGIITVDVPSWRATKDISIPADIVEEVMRVYGYDNIEPATTRSPLRPVAVDPQKQLRDQVKDRLAERFCLHEAHSYIWCNSVRWKKLGLPAEDEADALRLANAQAAQCSVLRTSILPSLLDFAESNKNVRPEFGLFEIGKIVDGAKPDGSANEREVLGIVLFSKISGEKEVYLKLRDILAYLGDGLRRVRFEFPAAEARFPWQHPKNSAAICYDGQQLGFLSLLSARNRQAIDGKAAIAVAQLDMRQFTAIAAPPFAYRVPPKFPGINYDLSLLTLPETRYADLEAVLRGVDCPYLRDIRVIDIFDGEKASITLRLAFQSDDKSLVFEEIKQYVDEMLLRLGGMGIYLKA